MIFSRALKNYFLQKIDPILLKQALIKFTLPSADTLTTCSHYKTPLRGDSVIHFALRFAYFTHYIH